MIPTIPDEIEPKALSAACNVSVPDGTKSMGEWAITYAQAGWAVIPLHTPEGSGCSCGDPECGKHTGKHPRIEEWQKVQCDPAAVAKWWKLWPNANIGLRLDGLSVLDVDVTDRKGGAESLAALEAVHGPLDLRGRQQSGSGASHYVFAEVEGMKRHLGFRPGLDMLTGPGCYIVAEPSLHLSGGRYHWLDEINPLKEHRDQISLFVPPGWLQDAASKPQTNATTAPANSAGERVPVERMLSLAVDKIKVGESRNAAGFWFFCQLRDAGCDRTEASLTVHEWVEKANGAAPTKHRYTKTEADATLRSVYKRNPRAKSSASKTSENPVEILLNLIADFEYFKSGPCNDAYVRTVIGDHKEVWKVDTKSLKVREVMTHRYLAKNTLAPSREALNVVLDTVLARCSMGPKVDVHVRFARSRDAIFLDLCDDRWRAIEITKEGWNVVNNPPVLFRRYNGAQPLPLPTKGGSLESLRPLLNADDDAPWLLMIGWLVGVFLPEGLYPAVDPLQSNSKMATPGIVGKAHYELAQEIRRTLAQYEQLKDIIAMLGLEQLSAEDRKVVGRARRLERFLTQPFFTTEKFTSLKGKTVSLKDALDGCQRILRDEFKDCPESALYMIGAIGEAQKPEAKPEPEAVHAAVHAS